MARNMALSPGNRLQTGRFTYAELELVELARLVVEESDRLALKEIHDNRPVFRFKKPRPLLLSEYLADLREDMLEFEGAERRTVAWADRAYDLTLDKFFHLPDARNRIDCRLYYKPFIHKISEKNRTNPLPSRLQSEARAGITLQWHVRNHFKLSLREAMRELDPFWSRYRWEVRGKSINLRLPNTLSGNQRRAWLDTNIPHPDPDRPGEKKRIQEIIDSSLSGECLVSMVAELEEPIPYDYDLSLPLSENVGQEKAHQIGHQRPAIRSLGPKKLKDLVQRIFEDLDAEEYRQNRIAREFGLSTGTLSRFAGANWDQDSPEKGAIPDLWVNTARFIVKNPVFREAVREEGMLKQVYRVIAAEDSPKGKGADHG